jgi:hypothetical protein
MQAFHIAGQVYVSGRNLVSCNSVRALKTHDAAASLVTRSPSVDAQALRYWVDMVEVMLDIDLSSAYE